MLIEKKNSVLNGIRMKNQSGAVIFTTGGEIEKNGRRHYPRFQLNSFELKPDERIIGIRSHDDGQGWAWHYNVQFVIG